MSPPPIQPSLHPRVLCIWLPNWPIQRVTAADPPRVNGPLLLATRDARRGQVVAAVNLAGRRAGIRPGMRLSEATALVDVEIREYDPQEDIDALCQLAEQAQQFSPLVGLEQLDKKLWAGRTLLQAECLLLDVTGIAGLFGGEQEMLEQVADWLSRQHYFGCLALAGSVGAAWGLANYRLRSDASSPKAFSSQVPSTQAPSTTTSDRPLQAPVDLPVCRTCVVPIGQDATAIEELPLAALRLAAETIQTLQRLGIRTIGQLAQLPRAGMATRLGDELLARWDQAAGRQGEPIITLPGALDWSLQQTLEYPTQHRETMVELVRRLTRELAERLGRRGEGALRIVCRLDLIESPPLVMQLGLFRPCGDAQHMQLLLTGQLEQQLQSRTFSAGTPPLWRLSLQATLTAPLAWRQTELFDAGETVSRQQIARLVDTLSSRLGRKAVVAARICREAQPELACQLRPLTGRRPDGVEQDTARKLSSRLARRRGEPSREDPQRRPTHLFSPPLAIQVATRASQAATSEVGASAAGVNPPPARFKHLGVWLEIEEATGPERLESGWWRGPSARRDYYRVTTSQAGWWWIYRDLNTAQWYLHGAFD